MSAWKAEVRLLFRAPLSAGALLLLLLLSALSVAAGLAATARQRAVIGRVEAAQRLDRASVVQEYGKPDGDAGSAAYYTFHLTTDPPSPLTFAALGQRDVQPYVLRVRLLGLQSQLYESETLNPELALPGAFDFAFVLIYLAPLVIIALMYDLVSGEREAGRLRLLVSLPVSGRGVWARRSALRYLLVLGALLGPFGVGAVIAGAPVGGSFAVALAAALYVLFWLGLALWVAARGRSSAANGAVLMGCWIVLTLLAPALANAVISRALPVAKGIDLTLAQRERVHRAWDIPKQETFQPFFVKHPEWKDTPPVLGRFHWKWYYAMHEVGDDGVSAEVAEYRRSLTAREVWTARLGWLLPAVAVQTLLHRTADSDLLAHLAYQHDVERFHTGLRDFYYPYLFQERPFQKADFEQVPRYAPRPSSASLPVPSLLGLLVLVALVSGAAVTAVRSLSLSAAPGTS
ncbi:ABC transporter permease [Corallococcus exercitus]|uniref:ABC transporter permease n=1 Tax=Corallococcus exercitus TaxID=2316736 RepID=UPI0035D4998D